MQVKEARFARSGGLDYLVFVLAEGTTRQQVEELQVDLVAMQAAAPAGSVRGVIVTAATGETVAAACQVAEPGVAFFGASCSSIHRCGYHSCNQERSARHLVLMSVPTNPPQAGDAALPKLTGCNHCSAVQAVAESRTLCRVSLGHGWACLRTTSLAPPTLCWGPCGRRILARTS